MLKNRSKKLPRYGFRSG